jgi:hypothetical protein
LPRGTDLGQQRFGGFLTAKPAIAILGDLLPDTILLALLMRIPPIHGRRMMLLLQLLLRLLLFRPIIQPVTLKPTLLPQIVKQFPAVLVVRLVLELQVFGVVEIDDELVGETLAQKVHGSGHLLLHYHRVFLFGVFGFHVLPREDAPEEIHQHVADGLQVVSPGLLDTDVGVDGGISGSSCELFAVLIGYVLS